MIDTLPTFSNPRKTAMVEDWPIGSKRCRTRFVVEVDDKRGERVARYTENKDRTGWNKPKRNTYASSFVIVDGDDGRTYLLSYSKNSSQLTVHSSDMKHHLQTVWPETDSFGELHELIAKGGE